MNLRHQFTAALSPQDTILNIPVVYKWQEHLNKMYPIDLKTGEISIGICGGSAMIELNPEIKNALIKIDYIKRYEELSDEH